MMEHKKSKGAKQVKKYCTYLAYPRTVLDFTRVFMSTKTFIKPHPERDIHIRRASFSKHKKKVVYTGTKTSNPKTKTKPRTQK